MLIDQDTCCLYDRLSNSLEQTPRVCPTMWCSKENDACRGSQDVPQMLVVLLAARGPSQSLFDKDAAQAVGNKQDRPGGIGSPLGLDLHQEVPRHIVDGALVRRRAEDVSETCIVPICQDPRVRNRQRKQVPWPVHRSVRFCTAVLQAGERVDFPDL